MSKENAQEFSFMWKIHNFSFAFYKNGDSIESPVFEIESFGGSQWSLKLYPRGEDRKDSEFLSIFLLKKKSDIYAPISSIIYELEFVMDDGSIVGREITVNHEYGIDEPFGWKRYRAVNFVSDILKKWPENVLTLRCRMFNTRKQRSLDIELHTEIPVNRSSFLWNVKIQDLSSRMISKEFYFSENSLYAITLRLSEDSKQVKICISQKREESSCAKYIECKISLVNSNKKAFISKRADHIFEPIGEKDDWEFPPFITSQDLYSKSDICVNGIFSLFCEIVSSNGIESTAAGISSKYVATKKSNRAVLHEDLKSMLFNHIHSDIKLKADNEVVHAHKSILATRSPVFLAMFEQDMIESSTGVVDIPDLEVNVLKVFLEFIYTGRVENFDYEKAKKLFVVADKYQVPSLTEKCVSFLEAILSMENAIEILSIADMINNGRLKNTVMNFIATNSTVIFKAPEWQDLMREHLHLASEMISVISTNFKVTSNN